MAKDKSSKSREGRSPSTGKTTKTSDKKLISEGFGPKHKMPTLTSPVIPPIKKK